MSVLPCPLCGTIPREAHDPLVSLEWAPVPLHPRRARTLLLVVGGYHTTLATVYPATEPGRDWSIATGQYEDSGGCEQLLRWLARYVASYRIPCPLPPMPEMPGDVGFVLVDWSVADQEAVTRVYVDFVMARGMERK